MAKVLNEATVAELEEALKAAKKREEGKEKAQTEIGKLVKKLEELATDYSDEVSKGIAHLVKGKKATASSGGTGTKMTKAQTLGAVEEAKKVMNKKDYMKKSEVAEKTGLPIEHISTVFAKGKREGWLESNGKKGRDGASRLK